MTSQDPAAQYDGLRQEIERTRAELGETVEALAAKADVKSRAQQMAEDAKARVRDSVDDAARGTVGVANKGLEVTNKGLGAATKGIESAKKGLEPARKGLAPVMKGLGTVKRSTHYLQAMINRPIVWVLAALGGIGVVSAVSVRRRPAMARQPMVMLPGRRR
jgi:hypothetical protein